MWNLSLSECQEHFLCSYIHIIYGRIRLRAILWRFYWKDSERCRNSRSAINIMCFDFSILSVMWNRPEDLFRLGLGFYMILSTAFDISIWAFNVLFVCMTGFYTHIQYTPPPMLAHVCSYPHSSLSYKQKYIYNLTNQNETPFFLLNKPDFRQYVSHLSIPWVRSVRVLWPRREPAVCSS